METGFFIVGKLKNHRSPVDLFLSYSAFQKFFCKEWRCTIAFLISIKTGDHASPLLGFVSKYL